MTRRLVDLGATPDEVASFADAWDQAAPGEAWGDEQRRALLHASDEVLLDEIRQVRSEYPYQPVEPPEPVDAGEPVVGAIHIEADVPDAEETSVRKLLAWVNDAEPAEVAQRARVVLDAESKSGRPERTSLTTPLRRIVEAADAGS